MVSGRSPGVVRGFKGSEVGAGDNGAGHEEGGQKIGIGCVGGRRGGFGDSGRWRRLWAIPPRQETDRYSVHSMNVQGTLKRQSSLYFGYLF